MPSQIEYAGIEIHINRVRSARKAIRDGPNYLYTRHFLHCTGVYNPEATAYTRGEDGPVEAFGDQNILAPETDVAIRNTLMQPRRKLIYTVGTKTVLESPWTEDPKQTMDDNNGPTPLECNVTQVHGRKTFDVEFLIQTDVNENRIDKKDGNITNAKLILSNTYAMEDELDHQFFLTRVTRGKAVFSTGILQAIENGTLKVNGEQVSGAPDVFRKIVTELVPVPDDCQREHFRYAIDEYNNSLTYAFTDRERAYNLITANFPNIVEIRATQTRTENRPDEWSVKFSEALFGLIGGVAGAYLGQSKANFSLLGFNLSGIGAIAGGAAGGAIGASLASVLPANMPRLQDEWTLEIFGNVRCTKKSMLDCATMILNEQLKRTKAGGLTGFVGKATTRTSFDLLGVHLTVNWTYELGYIEKFVSMLAGDVGFRLPSPNIFGEGIPGVATSQVAPNPVPPGDKVSRGFVKKRMFVPRGA